MKNFKYKYFCIITFVISFSGYQPNAHAATSQKVLKVGLVFRLNDKYNTSVKNIVKGVTSAKKVFESENPDVLIKFYYFSHEESLSTVLTAAQKVIGESLPAVIGGEMSEESIVLKDVLNPKKIVFITPTSSNPRVTENAPFVFRACFNDRDVAGKLANYSIDNLHAKSIGIIRNYSSPYTDYLAKSMLSALTARSDLAKLKIIEKAVERDQANYKNEITSFIQEKVTHVLMPTHQSDLLRFMNQASQLNFFPTYIGSDGWGTNEDLLKRVIEEGKNERFIAYRNYYVNEKAKGRKYKSFMNAFKSLYSEEPTAWSMIGFDTAYVLFRAMRISPVGDSEAIRKNLSKSSFRDLLTTSSFSFESDNSPKKDLFIYKLDKSGIQFETTLK